MLAAGTAQAGVTVVPPGDSIQAAVDAASPGDTIRLQRGIYQGGVLILNKDGLSIRGAGPGKTVLVEPATVTLDCGICVVGELYDENAFVRDTSIRGLSVVGFYFGVSASAVRGLSLADVAAERARANAINVYTGYDIDIRAARSNAAGSAGVYLNAVSAATIADSDVRDSGGPGFEVFASGDGRIHHSSAIGNCSGVELRTGKGEPTVVVGLQAWRVDHVTAVDNTRRCQAWRSEGAGIFAYGGRGLRIDNNVVRRNGYEGSPTAGGIVINAHPFDDMDAGNPGGVTVQRNVVTNNAPFDLRWDGNPVPPELVSFVENRCVTSEPAGLCRGGASSQEVSATPAVQPPPGERD